jgi:predicted transcriptional regulator
LGLFLKEKSFLDRPFAVLNTVLSSALWDTRPSKDSVSLIALMNAYISKTTNMAYLLKYVRATEPMIVKGKMYFANFNFDFSRNIISSLMKDQKLPRLPRKDGNYLLFE